ncbi:TOBE domain-containing protein [Gordonia sp. NPDC003429]
MKLSIRNQLPGIVTEVQIGVVSAVIHVRLKDTDYIVTSSITKEAAEDLELAVGKDVTVLVKSSEVSLGV